jgi:hypothetical protein
VIEAQPRRDVERHASPRHLRGREQDLLLDGDVSQETSTELVVRSEIDRLATLGGVEQRLQPAMVGGQMIDDRLRGSSRARP